MPLDAVDCSYTAVAIRLGSPGSAARTLFTRRSTMCWRMVDATTSDEPSRVASRSTIELDRLEPGVRGVRCEEGWHPVMHLSPGVTGLSDDELFCITGGTSCFWVQ